MSVHVRVFKVPQGGDEPLVKVVFQKVRRGKPDGAERAFHLTLRQAIRLRGDLTAVLRDVLGAEP